MLADGNALEQNVLYLHNTLSYGFYFWLSECLSAFMFCKLGHLKTQIEGCGEIIK